MTADDIRDALTIQNNLTWGAIAAMSQREIAAQLAELNQQQKQQNRLLTLIARAVEDLVTAAGGTDNEPR